MRKDIEDHQKECKKVSDELSILKEEVDNMIRKNNLNYIEANVDIDDLPNFDSVISNIKYKKKIYMIYSYVLLNIYYY